MEYLTNAIDPVSKGLREPHPEVLKGDPARCAALIESLHFEHVYKSGVLAWEKGEQVTPEQERQAIRRFERVAFPGLHPEQYEVVFVRHTHEGKHEIHFIVAQVELRTGKSMNINPPGKHQQEAWNLMRDAYNLEYGFSSPTEKSRQREHSLPGHIYLQKAQAHKKGLEPQKDIRESMHEYLRNLAVDGLVKNREGIVKAIKDLGLEIPRQGDSYITIRDPKTEERFRLKGGMYDRHWELGRALESERRRARESQPDDVAAREKKVRDLQQQLERFIQSRSRFNQERYRERGRDVEKERALALQVQPTKPALDRANDIPVASARDIEPQLLPIVEITNATPGDRYQLSRDNSPRGAITGLTALDRRGGSSHNQGEHDQAQPERNCDRASRSITEEVYDRIRDTIATVCRQVDERVKRAREAIALAIGRIDRAVQSGRATVMRVSRSIESFEYTIDLEIQRRKTQQITLPPFK